MATHRSYADLNRGAGFRVQSANRYTIGPRENGLKHEVDIHEQAEK